MIKDNIIKNFNKIFRTDPYILDLCESLGLELDKIDELCQKIYLNMFIDTIDEDLGIPIYSKTLNIVIDESLPIEEKRSIIQAKWRSKGKCSEELLQSVANAWKNGDVSVNFESDLIKVRFISDNGIPTEISKLQEALDKVKPAYLIVKYIISNLIWNLFESYNWDWDTLESKNLTWDELEGI